ncbi:hypothetical protein MANES_18G075650v8 [Manihot esculenta]|uniref:Uncharacterized protein n=1 Tax=Manihot esculenta TaxID=3983 RepID=A0ACB7FZJ2_MANES|nr:hypothetical protein MANES_18G075650v8 [Manihot esculenta]
MSLRIIEELCAEIGLEIMFLLEATCNLQQQFDAELGLSKANAPLQDKIRAPSV